MDLRQVLREWFGQGEDDPGALQRASRDFQSAFDGRAIQARQRLPMRVVNALSASGVPGWQGMAIARNRHDAARAALEAPSSTPVAGELRAALRDLATDAPDYGVASPPSPPHLERRGVEPASAEPGPSIADQENRAFQEARARARAQIGEEGAPYFRDPSHQNAGQALAMAIDRDRAAEAEMRRREGVSWQDWWRFGGRQDQSQYDPSLPAYRFTRPPPRYSARSRNPTRR